MQVDASRVRQGAVRNLGVLNNKVGSVTEEFGAWFLPRP